MRSKFLNFKVFNGFLGFNQLIRDNWLSSHSNDLVILVVGLVLQVMFLVQVVLKQFESLSRRDLFKEKELIYWKFLALLFEVTTLVVSENEPTK